MKKADKNGATLKGVKESSTQIYFSCFYRIDYDKKQEEVTGIAEICSRRNRTRSKEV